MKKVKINPLIDLTKLLIATGRISLFNRKQLYENVNIGIGYYLYILLPLNSSTWLFSILIY